VNYLDEELGKIGVEIIPNDAIVRNKPAIGSGKFGKVYRGKYQNKVVAIKKMVFTQDAIQDHKKDLLREIENIKWAAKDSEQVPCFHGVWKGIKGHHYHLVFEFIEGTTLREVMPKLDDKEKMKVIYEICQLMNYFHMKKFFHRDLKPENIMISGPEKKVKLIDFGTARLASQTITYTSAALGTAFYMAPDNFHVDEDGDHEDNPEKVLTTGIKVDVWSIGCIITEILSGVFPWSNLTKNPTYVESFLIHKKPFPMPKEIEEKYPDFKDILEKCFKINPLERCSCQDLLDFIKSKIQ